MFEHSPRVAERAWTHRPFFSVDQLHGVMAAEVAGARPNEQLALLRAHPDLGARVQMDVDEEAAVAWAAFSSGVLKNQVRHHSAIQHGNGGTR